MKRWWRLIVFAVVVVVGVLDVWRRRMANYLREEFKYFVSNDTKLEDGDDARQTED